MVQELRRVRFHLRSPASGILVESFHPALTSRDGKSIAEVPLLRERTNTVPKRE